MTLSLAELSIYPVKSAGGITLTQWTVDAFGLRYDRRWMIVDDDGVFLSQREDPRLALIETAIAGDRLELRTARQEPIAVPLEPADGPRVHVQVWSDTVPAEPCAPDVDAWLSEALHRPARLVRMPGDVLRQVDRRYGKRGERTSFTDGFPFLLIGSASLEELNGRLAQPVPMNRFRPNLVVTGARPYEEDEWARIQVGAIGFRVSKPCGRCVVTTTDQETGVRGAEPLRTLATYRRRRGKVVFGQNLVHEETGPIAVGDAVVVVERRQ